MNRTFRNIWLFLIVLTSINLWLIRYEEDEIDFDFKESTTTEETHIEVPSAFLKFLTPRPDNSSRFKPNISEIQSRIAQDNFKQRVYNEDLFGPLQNDSIVIVIQVHNRILYLRNLIVSLAQARNISQTLIIFSHDVYDEEINNLVRSIDFCRVLQIFYPYSIQLHPHKFPGDDPNDCPRNIKKELALLMKCNNAQFPDLYGHYREAKFAQTKHHWWWKANRVFNQLEITKTHNGSVLFLEEDHYVAEDFIHVLKLMEETRTSSCENCNVLVLGSYKSNFIFEATVEITPWYSGKHNMGMAFNRSTWMQIVNCSDTFCNYDDYNWDWTLQQSSENCLKHKLHAMVITNPRVFHVGECGVHHKKNCESTAEILKVRKLLNAVRRYLYPNNLMLIYVNFPKNAKNKCHGGWGDHRDHILCMSMTLK